MKQGKRCILAAVLLVFSAAGILFFADETLLSKAALPVLLYNAGSAFVLAQEGDLAEVF